MAMQSVSPTTGEVLEVYETDTREGVTSAIEDAHRAFGEWRRQPVARRASRLAAAAEVLEAERDEHARRMAEEMGKPIVQGRAEVDKCAWVCRYYAEHAERFLSAESIETDAARSYVSPQPLGVVLAVMPWNFPYWQVFRFAAPTLAAGNAALLKHASNVPGCALAIQRVLEQAGFPEGLFRTLLVGSSEVATVLDDPRVRAVSLTGSTPAGQAVAAHAGRRLKKSLLELGGSDPYLVLADADLEHAAEVCAESRLINSGQSCIAAKRFVVVAEVADEFVERLVAAMRRRRVGDPLDTATAVGPQARRDLRDELHRQVEASVAGGARLLLGGEVPPEAGAFYPPSVLDQVVAGTPACEEELFGPVAAVVRVRDEDEAVRVANDTVFGLGAAVFSRDVERAERLAAERLEAGCCFVNDLVRSDPRLPFGGVKDSGYGRELGRQGILEFVNLKTVWVR